MEDYACCALAVGGELDVFDGAVEVVVYTVACAYVDESFDDLGVY